MRGQGAAMAQETESTVDLSPGSKLWDVVAGQDMVDSVNKTRNERPLRLTMLFCFTCHVSVYKCSSPPYVSRV